MIDPFYVLPRRYLTDWQERRSRIIGSGSRIEEDDETTIDQTELGINIIIISMTDRNEIQKDFG